MISISNFFVVAMGDKDHSSHESNGDAEGTYFKLTSLEPKVFLKLSDNSSLPSSLYCYDDEGKQCLLSGAKREDSKVEFSEDEEKLIARMFSLVGER